MIVEPTSRIMGVTLSGHVRDRGGQECIGRGRGLCEAQEGWIMEPKEGQCKLQAAHGEEEAGSS